MLKNSFQKITLLVLIAVSACSCNKYLELRPQNGVTADQFWQTKEQLQSAVIGCYYAMEVNPTTSQKTPAELFLLWGELRADFIVPGLGIAAAENDIINTNILPTNAIVKWQPIYRVINFCNYVLDFGPDVISRDHTLTQDQLNNYLGEALALRSLMYFYLVRSYGDVPLKLHSTSTDDGLQQLAKTKQADILKQIVADLKTAEGYCPAAYSTNASDKGRINKFTCDAILADVYLWMDDYADAITACDKVINSGKYALVPGGPNWFNTLYGVGNSNEGIFELQFDGGTLNPYFNMFSSTVKYRFKAQPSIVDNFYSQDINNPLNADIRGSDVAIHIADGTVYKYTNLTATTFRTADVSYAHWIFYRFADVLLMKAEACANSSRGQETLDIINQIRTRANALPATSQSPDVADVNGLTNYVLAERAREFPFEGKRWYDLLRIAKRNNFARRDVLIGAAATSVPPLYQQSAFSKLQDGNFLYFPVPQDDIQNDPNLVQNPFYK